MQLKKRREKKSCSVGRGFDFRGEHGKEGGGVGEREERGRGRSLAMISLPVASRHKKGKHRC